MPVKAKPDGYNTITPYLVVSDGAKAIEFYKKAFGATERFRMGRPDGKIGHAELQFGDSVLMLSDECLEMGAKAPQGGGLPVTLYLYMDNVDAVVDRAVSAGATLKRAVATQFYGDRSGGVEDPFGHTWYVATHVEDVSPDELQKRMAAMPKKN
jgi:PhnB protein